MQRFLKIIILTIGFFPQLFSCNNIRKESEAHYLNFASATEIQHYFKYKGDSSVVISGHRGGRESQFPENSIEGLQNTLNQMPVFFEIDPRLTKDSVIVLMHDKTIDRTTTGNGKLSDFTYSELQSFNLKDYEGKVTPYKIPTLEEVIVWSKGKTVINLDKKDVPLEMIAALINKLGAETHVMLTVHNGNQAKFYNDRFPGVMLSVFSRNEKEYNDIANSGVPWQNMIAYVGRSIDENNAEVVKKLHSHGVRCMISVAPTHDKLKNSEERQKAYQEEILKHPDIIETDIPLEVYPVLHSYKK